MPAAVPATRTALSAALHFAPFLQAPGTCGCSSLGKLAAVMDRPSVLPKQPYAACPAAAPALVVPLSCCHRRCAPAVPAVLLPTSSCISGCLSHPEQASSPGFRCGLCEPRPVKWAGCHWHEAHPNAGRQWHCAPAPRMDTVASRRTAQITSLLPCSLQWCRSICLR